MRTAAKSLVDQLSLLAKTDGDIYISMVPFDKESTSAPADATSTVLQYCASGTDKFYLVTDPNQTLSVFNAIGQSLAKLRVARAQVIRMPAPAVAFDYRRVIFVVLPNTWIVELIERGPVCVDAAAGSLKV